MKELHNEKWARTIKECAQTRSAARTLLRNARTYWAVAKALETVDMALGFSTLVLKYKLLTAQSGSVARITKRALRMAQAVAQHEIAQELTGKRLLAAQQVIAGYAQLCAKIAGVKL